MIYNHINTNKMNDVTTELKWSLQKHTYTASHVNYL